MADKKSRVMAQVQLTVEIDLQDAWGTDCSLGQVENQARDGALAAIQHGILIGQNRYVMDRDPKTVGRIVSTPRVLSIIVDSEGEDRQRAEMWAQRRAATKKQGEEAARLADVMTERDLLASYVFKLSAAAGLAPQQSDVPASELAGAVSVMEDGFHELDKLRQLDGLRRDNEGFGKIVEDVMAKLRDVCSPGDEVVEVVGRIVAERDALHGAMIWIAEQLGGVGSKLASNVRDWHPDATPGIKAAWTRVFDTLVALTEAMKRCGVATGVRLDSAQGDDEWTSVAEMVEKMSRSSVDATSVMEKQLVAINGLVEDRHLLASAIVRIAKAAALIEQDRDVASGIDVQGLSFTVADKVCEKLATAIPVDPGQRALRADRDRLAGVVREITNDVEKLSISGEEVGSVVRRVVNLHMRLIEAVVAAGHAGGIGGDESVNNVAHALSVLSKIEQKLRDGLVVGSGG